MQMSDTARAADESQRPRFAYPECADREQGEREGQGRRSHVYLGFSLSSGAWPPFPGATLFNAALLQLRETDLEPEVQIQLQALVIAIGDAVDDTRVVRGGSRLVEHRDRLRDVV